LRGHYRSRFRRDWALAAAKDIPHFFDHRITAVELAVGEGSATSWMRAFYTLEVLPKGCRLLDIGCGDGFFDRHFFVDRCAAIDAIDIEPSSIAHARRHSAHERIAYAQLDATRDAFPSEPYDVVVFDGAIGHFSDATTDAVLTKVAAALADDGMFVGSESLGVEGEDHLQFFAEVDDLARLLRRHFPAVALREVGYTTANGVSRREAFWRCASTPGRLDATVWQRFDAVSPER
jgi:cyclopropane fatty-acyl-phospholipid synthase-like methyltransferase